MLFVVTFVKNRTDDWIDELDKLVHVAEAHPQCAYAAFTHVFVPKWNYLMRVVSFQSLTLSANLSRLEHAIRDKLLPKLTGQMPPGDIERDLLELPSRLGGMTIVSPISSHAVKFQEALELSQPLVDKLLTGDPSLHGVHSAQLSHKRHHKKESERRWAEKKECVCSNSGPLVS